MPNPKLPNLRAIRGLIAGRLRELRLARRWTQAELAERLALSQSRLSEIERGDGSLSAEQFLLVLSLFNVSPAEFVPVAPDHQASLQNALARLGAAHLQESDSIVPNARVDDPAALIADALADGSPRLVTALAPVLLRHAKVIKLPSVQQQLSTLGFGSRVPWLVDNTLDALARVRSERRDVQYWANVERRAFPLAMFLETIQDVSRDGKAQTSPDIIDPTIRSKRAADEVARTRSEISAHWNVITRIVPEDFVEPIRSSLGPERVNEFETPWRVI